MAQSINRREFITASAGIAAGLGFGRGTSVNSREGSVRWPVLRQALEAVNYNGWMTIESNGDIPFEERNRRLDLILAGQ